MSVVSCSIPSNSKVRRYLSEIYYWDSFEVNRNELDLDIREVYLGIFSFTPSWLKPLIVIRNKIVDLFGVKGPSTNELYNIERKAAYKVGEKIGLFTLYSIEENEVIVGDDDKHLDFRVSVLVKDCGQSKKVIVTTIVKVNNIFGKAYLFVILPFHKLGVKTLMHNASVEGRV